jgi:sodium/potassium/calcium exchanger 2
MKKDLETGSARDPVVIVTPLGSLRGRPQIKAACQSVAFVCVIAGYGVVHLYNTYNASFPFSPEVEDDYSMRLLQDANATAPTSPTAAPTDDPCADFATADPKWLCVFYAIGVLYMFLALAIVCDEFFVPALEEMSSPRRLNLSMDVAGATLMAAGGSAPELFTSLFGTFQESDIGFGTIVGSAVFNVLFVIAMCSLLAKETLNLTWWPLFRDSLYYAIGLGVLAYLVGQNSPNEIELWESLVLFAMYLGYILIMWQNANLYKLITGKALEYPDGEEEDGDDADKENGDKQENGDKENGENNDAVDNKMKPEEPSSRDELQEEGMKKNPSRSSVMSNISASQVAHHQPPHFRWQGTFRAGILKLLKDPNSWMDTAGVGIVAKIAGDADYVFSQVDMDGNGHVDREELKQLFNLLECYITPEELEEVFNQLDEDHDGTVSLHWKRKSNASCYLTP